MVTVCGRKFANAREKLLLTAKENKPALGTMENFFSKTKRQKEQAGGSSGTFIPNSTFKSIRNSAKEQKSSTATLGQSTSLSNPIKPSSILSGTGTLEELKQMRELLRKTSYVPKQPPSRRPTIEKIKSAIEQEKRVLMDEREALQSVKEESLQLNDMSTSTTAIKGKRTKKKSKRESPNKRKMGGKVKMKRGKVDVEIQCSISKAP